MSEVKHLLAIDQSIACTGWCLFDKEAKILVDFGCIKTKKGDGSLRDRCTIIENEFGGYIGDSHIEVVREGLGFGASNSNASRDLAYLVGHLERANYAAMQEVAPTRLKKYATGSGKADKAEMIAALPKDVLTKFSEKGYKKTTGLSDLADAYFIGQYFLNLDGTF